MPRWPDRHLPPGMRWCPSCKRGVLFKDYTKSVRGPGGFGGSCKACKAVTKKAQHKRYESLPDTSAEARFWAKVEKTEGCWNWTGTKRHGHGHFLYRGKMARAHRVSLIFAGVTIPDGMHIDHACRNRGCVRPEHLRVVTPRQNALENSASPVAARAAMVGGGTCKYGHPWVPENIATWIVKRRKNRHGNYTQTNVTMRTCLTCKRERARAYEARKKARTVLPKVPVRD